MTWQRLSLLTDVPPAPLESGRTSHRPEGCPETEHREGGVRHEGEPNELSRRDRGPGYGTLVEVVTVFVTVV